MRLKNIYWIIKSPTRKLIILEAVSIMGVRLRKHLEISSLQLFGQTVILPSGKMLGRQETVMFS